MNEEKVCNEAWDTQWPCDLPAGHEGDHKNLHTRSPEPEEELTEKK